MSDRTNPPPAPELGPGPLFVPTEAGFDLAPRVPAAAERTDPAQVALHARLRARVARLGPVMVRVGNTHKQLADEFDDYSVFVASDPAELDVASLWSAGSGLAEFVDALDAPLPAGSMTEAIEPEPLALLRTLLMDHWVFINRFALGRELSALAAERRIAKEPSQQIGATAARLLAAMLAVPDLLAGRARPLVNALKRAHAALDTVTLQWSTAASETLRNALIGFGRAILDADRSSKHLDRIVIVVGGPTINQSLQAAAATAFAFLDAHSGDIILFAASQGSLLSWLKWLIDDLRGVTVPAQPAVESPVADPAATPEWASAAGRDQYGDWADITVGEVKQRLRWIPPGRFLMGSPEDESGRDDDEGPRHEVTFGQGFWMFDTACTEELWTAVMNRPTGARKSGRHPITDVSWDDAREFTTVLNARLPGLALGLPSEAQWEYACRAGTNTPYSFGETIDRSQVNFGGDGTVPVGSLPPNGWGLYEMHGNIWEWCADHWHGSYEGAPIDGSAWIDPDELPGFRVLRGGAWNRGARLARAACRDRAPERRVDRRIGFRCARVQSGSGASEAGRRAGRGEAPERSDKTAAPRPPPREEA